MTLPVTLIFLTGPLLIHVVAEDKQAHLRSAITYGKTAEEPTTLHLIWNHITEKESNDFAHKKAEKFQEQPMNKVANTSHFVYAHPLNNNDTLVFIKHMEADVEIASDKGSATESIHFLVNRSECTGAKKESSNCTNLLKINNKTWNASEMAFRCNKTANKTNGNGLKSLLELKPYIDAILVSLICLIGLIGNIPIVIIFIRHAEMRKASNIYIFTTVIGDLLCIIVNLLFFLVFFLLSNGQWSFGIYFCKFFFFASDLSVGLSIFGLTALSVQRYCGILANPFDCSRGRHLCFSKRMRICDILFVWVASFLLALRTFITADVVNGRCESVTNYDLSKTIAILNFVIFAFFPLFLLVVFHGLTARYLFASAKKIPGADTRKQNALKHAREKSARVLLSITFVFFTSYVPWFSWQIIFLWGHFKDGDNRVLYCFWILYYLFFGSVCFNPIALYCISSSFRRLFQHYLCCFRSVDIMETIPRRNEDTLTETSFTVPEVLQK